MVNYTKTLTIIILSFLLFSCNNTENTKTDESRQIDDDFQIQDVTFYLIPSAIDLLSTLNYDSIRYSKIDLVYSKQDSHEKYKNFEIILGYALTDVIYFSFYSNEDLMIESLKTIKELSNKLRIDINFNIQEDTKISLTFFSNLYRYILNELERNNRVTELAHVSAGAWLESLYIITQITHSYNKDEATIQLIADQKYVIENLFLYLKKVNGNSNHLSEIIEMLKPIKAIYDKLKIEKIEEQVSETAPEGYYLVGGTTKIIITKEQFEELKQTIEKIRNKLTKTNV